MEVRTSPNYLILPTLEPNCPATSLIILKAGVCWGFQKAFFNTVYIKNEDGKEREVKTVQKKLHREAVLVQLHI